MDLEKTIQRQYLMAETLAVFLFQLTVSIFIGTSMEWSTVVEVPSVAVSFTRLIAGLLMQVMLAREFQEGLNKMKFVLNHQWKFES